MHAVLRRMKSELIDSVSLPHKREEVLFCHLTPEQYQLYVDFLQMRWKGQRGSQTWSVYALRRLCNHPDLLFMQNNTKFTYDHNMVTRSGKMKVMSRIVSVWHRDNHRVLIFAQQKMLEIIEVWMTHEKYTFLKIDASTACASRLDVITKYNNDTNIFALLLTVGIGGTGLNITGADRVLSYDPDWNPTNGARARERAWRIGQERDVAVYRLVVAGTIEDTIYRREIQKQMLSQRVLSEPGQQQIFKKDDLNDLFQLPVPPPNYDPVEMRKITLQYQKFFHHMMSEGSGHRQDTSDVLENVDKLSKLERNKRAKEVAAEHKSILNSLQESKDVTTSFSSEKLAQNLESNTFREGANRIAQAALIAIQRSARECASHGYHTPTWTGQNGLAGMRCAAGMKCAAAGTKSTASSPSSPLKRKKGPLPLENNTSRPPPGSIIAALKQLKARKDSRNNDRKEEVKSNTPQRKKTEKEKKSQKERDWKKLDPVTGLPRLEQSIAEVLLRFFLDPKLAGTKHRLTTGQVMEHVGPAIPVANRHLFKALLMDMCFLTKPSRPDQPGVWTLRSEFWPQSLKT